MIIQYDLSILDKKNSICYPKLYLLDYLHCFAVHACELAVPRCRLDTASYRQISDLIIQVWPDTRLWISCPVSGRKSISVCL